MPSLNLNETMKGGTFCLSKAGLAIGSTASKIKTLAPNGAGIDFAIKGILYHIDEGDDAIVMTAAAVQPVLTKCIYLVCIDKDGTYSTVKGTAVITADLVAGNAVLQWPVPTVDTCCIGAVKVQTLTSGTFTAGTTALTPAATLDTTYYDLFCVPSAPLTS